jgi:Asp/Glu/hydantoin racemase
MTASLSPLTTSLFLRPTLWNPTTGPASINNDADAETSTACVLRDLPAAVLQGTDAVLVACYSAHPLTRALPPLLPPQMPVLGIFEASVQAALAALDANPDNPKKPTARFGIVTTGLYWETALTAGVHALLAEPADRDRFKGVASTGLSAAQLHSAPAEQVRARVEEATRRLVRGGDVRVVCLGCAGMVGMDNIVRAACVKELGEEGGGRVQIVDGVKAGISILSGLILSSAATK